MEAEVFKHFTGVCFLELFNFIGVILGLHTELSIDSFGGGVIIVFLRIWNVLGISL